MEEIVIRAERRKGTGKGVARKVRREGKIPAIVYGKDISPIPICISLKEWERLKGRMKTTSIVSMEIEGDGKIERRSVMVKEVQRDAVNSQVLHVDFLGISLERTLQVEVPIVLVGEPKALQQGGIVEQHLRTIMVECLPRDIPDKIEIDIGGLEIGDSIHVHEVSLPGVRLLEHPEVAIVTLTPPEMEEKKKAEGSEG
jgi:large subunit ribosomal protein L25